MFWAIFHNYYCVILVYNQISNRHDDMVWSIFYKYQIIILIDLICSYIISVQYCKWICLVLFIIRERKELFLLIILIRYFVVL